MNYRVYKNEDEIETRLFVEHPRQSGCFLPVHRRPMRLPNVNYSSAECWCFVTFNVHSRCDVRFEGELGEIAWHWLWREIELIGCHVQAVCLMPDHVHLLLAPSGNGESVSDIVRRLKTMMCTVLRRRFNIYLKWQTSFYDHVLRDRKGTDAEFNAISRYIYDNPVTAGYPSHYPFRYRQT
jgi:REP element-mobilizing transposase RayT